MREIFVGIWDTVTFYGPAGASFFAVGASGLAAFLVWILIKSRK